MSPKCNISSPEFSFSELDLYALHMANVNIIFWIVFIGFRRYVGVDPRSVISYRRC